jgi:DNA-binding protein Fis
MHFTPYVLPAIVALVAKIAIFFYARYSKVHNLQTQLYLSFLFCMSIQNLLEIRFFLNDPDSMLDPPSVSGTLYFAVSILAISFLLHLALVMATSWRRTRENLSPSSLVIVYGPALLLEVLLFSGSLLVAGFERMGYTYTRIPGPLFYLWEIYSVGYLGVSAMLFVYGARTQVTRFRRLQNRLLLFGLLPIVAVVAAVVGLQHLGIRSFNATATLPFAITIFLAITAYATHQYRLFDIEFFIPWSNVRKRKTEFYKRIQMLLAQVAKMESVQAIVHSISDALYCPVALVGGPKPVLAMAGDAFGVARFPMDELKKLDRIVVANEISEALPDMHALMRRHKVAAIVPFHPHSQTAASWMLLGDAFSDQVYSPLDFKIVETLFSRLADHFLDNQLLLRSQLAEAEREMVALRQRLANAWEQLQAAGKRLESVEQENRTLLARNSSLLKDDIVAIEADLLDRSDVSGRTLDEHVFEFEARLIAKALARSDDNAERAAELLGIPAVTLYYKIRQYHLRNRDQKR